MTGGWGRLRGDHARRPWQISGACVSRVLRPIINGHDSEAYIRDRLREAVDVLRRLPYPCGGAPRAVAAATVATVRTRQEFQQ